MIRTRETIGPFEIECRRAGSGRPLLYLHDEDGLRHAGPFLDILARRFDVVAPAYPGFETSSLPDWIDRVQDFAFACLGLLEQLGLRDVVVVGPSLGGWVAAEMAVMDGSRLGALVFIGPLGAKFTARDALQFPDVFALPRDAVERLTYGRSRESFPKLADLDDDERMVVARNRETFALVAWEPFFHDPKLKHRLFRVTAPVLVLRGEDDAIVSRDYAERFSQAISGARLHTVDGAAHAAHVDAAPAVAELIARFVTGTQS